ncbi:hypothetical protein INT45_008090 [Circinella minor]|uniref:Uncharacterized protein n=1 Tax=Circinella minor TaxID=1195481 RepID=A0A8H7RFF7_9FUNG|nr:hypothetical protein INT45_008090 [Circinella minor]
MISSVFNNSNTPFELDLTARQVIGKLVAESSGLIPSGVFEGTFRDYHTKLRNMRAVDWISFLLYVVPTLVCDMFEIKLGLDQSNEVVDALVALVTGCSLALSWEITDDDIVNMKSAFEEWHQYMYDHVETNMYSLNMHLLRHIPEVTENLGPIRGISARSMERIIGYFKKRIRSTNNSAKHVGNILRCHQASKFYNLLKSPIEEQPRIKYAIEQNENDTLHNSDDMELWNHFSTTVDNYRDVNLRFYLVQYWR